MIHRLPVVAAILAGLTVLGMSLGALFTRMPPKIEEGRFLELTLRTVAKSTELIDPGLLTVVIVVLALLALTILFMVEYLTPKAGRRAPSKRRVRAMDEILGSLGDGPG